MIGSGSMTCGRRFDGQQVKDWPRDAEHLDRWIPMGGIVGQGQLGMSCSYCGSINPVTLLAKLRDGWCLIGTDKSYKWYLAQPKAPTVQVAKFYTVHLSKHQASEIVAMEAMGILYHSLYVQPFYPALDADAPSWLVRV